MSIFSQTSPSEFLGAAVMFFIAFGAVMIVYKYRRYLLKPFYRPNLADFDPAPRGWRPNAALIALVVYAIVAPIFFSRALQILPENWFPNFGDETVVVKDATGQEDANVDENVDENVEKNVEKNDAEENADATLETRDVENDAPLRPSSQIVIERTAREPETASDSTDYKSALKQNMSVQHPLARLLIRANDTNYFGLVSLVFFITVVLLAPITEETIFRVAFQGAVEAKTRELDSNAFASEQTYAQRKSSRFLQNVAIVVFPATVFALLHIGSPEDPSSPTPCLTLYRAMLTSGLANVVTLIFVYVFMRRKFRLTAHDLGLDPEFALEYEHWSQTCKRWTREFFCGVLCFLFILPFVYGIKGIAQFYFPDAFVAPIPIFFFAICEGVAYLKTHSAPLVVGMHVTLNFLSFTAIFVGLLL